MRKPLLVIALALVPQVIAAQAKKPKPAANKPVTAAPVAPAKPPVTAPPQQATPIQPQPAQTAQAEAGQAQIDAEAAKKHDVSEDLIESLKRKRVLNDRDYERKKDGGYITPLPLINYDPNTGVGYGARIYYFYNGQKEDPVFRRTPYRHQVYAQFFQTTNGYQYHELNWDAPYVLKSLFRVRSALVFEKNIWANFYGVGARSMAPLGAGYSTGLSYDKYSEFNELIRKVDPATGLTDSAFNRYSYQRPAGVLMLERDFFGGIVRPQFGFMVSRYTITDLRNSKVQATGGEGTSRDTLLTAYNQAGLINGYGGGFHNVVRAGIAIDTRDYEPDPNKGQLFEAIAEVSNKAYGSEFNFARYTVAEKFFYSPFEKLVDLVFAGRVAYTQAVGDVPFYVMNQFTSTERVYQSALGGLRSLRGYKENRFVANNIAVANLELRWTMFDFNVLGQNFAPILVPFFDIGSAFDQPKDVVTSTWKYAYGAGIRIAWNQATIIMVDYAMSKEDSNMFINFSHIF